MNIHLKEKPDWYLEKNPLGLVPTLETPSGQVICESTITCEYLDEAYPAKKLLPSDPFEKAQQKMLLEDYSKVGWLINYEKGTRRGCILFRDWVWLTKCLSKVSSTINLAGKHHLEKVYAKEDHGSPKLQYITTRCHIIYMFNPL